MEQLLCHLIGDYWLQNDWMALNKKKKFWVALTHAFVYTIPFLLLTRNLPALSIICISHAIIDGTNIVNKLNQIKNWNFKSALAQDSSIEWFETDKHKFELTKVYVSLYDGYSSRPLFIRIWLIIIQDNILHLLINYLVLKFI